MEFVHRQVKELFAKSGQEILELYKDGIKAAGMKLKDFDQREVQSWKKSVPDLIYLLEQAGLGELTILLEYELPSTGLRVDAVLLGLDSQGRLISLLLELKQWGAILPDDVGPCAVQLVDDPNEIIRQHPAAQLSTYETVIKCYHSGMAQQGFIVKQASYLPNFVDKEELFSGRFELYRSKYEPCCFIHGEDSKFVEFLQRIFQPVRVGTKVQVFVDGQYSMNDVGLQAITKVLKGERFVALLDEQRKMAIRVQQEISKFKKLNQPEERLVICLTGTVGTGKTVLGLDLLRYFVKTYGSGHAHFTAIPQTLRLILNGEFSAAGGDPDLKMYFGSTYSVLKNKVHGDLIIVDELHRLTEIDTHLPRLINQFKIVVLLQDDWQRIKLSEQGTMKNIRRVLGKLSINPIELTLTTQQRARHSGTLLEQVLAFLGNKKAIEDQNIQTYDLRLYSRLADLEAALHTRAREGKRVRFVAPFCWDWLSGNEAITIQDGPNLFQKAWNPHKEKQFNWYKQYDVSAVDEVGCIYTVQGLEFEYTGLIFWDDLVYNPAESRWEVKPSTYCDKNLIDEIVTYYGFKRTPNRTVWHDNRQYTLDEVIAKFDTYQITRILFRNIYYVLMTRGMEGMYVWFKDDGTRQHFLNHFGQVVKQYSSPSIQS
ncbi:DNA/RNA helicase domain-containing protein [Bacillus cereus]|uniref:DNA/RNA helicase domain-containing protein n=1 Tax=Bacillus cereus TaxID=1396 RepID=UPI000BFD2CC6|nr:DNA/RNA helicase domain-containing protein [Bacillus cereus]PGY11970.1 hypothetical protein COE23_18395 [Bacillus cereus]